MISDDLDYFWIIPHKLAGSSYPFAHFVEYYNLGFRAIVSLIPSPPIAEVMIEKYHVSHLSAPVPLFGWPDEEQSVTIMQFIDEHIKANQPVLVHCLQGNGRTGVVLGQYLIWTGMSAGDAINTVHSARHTAFDVPEQEQVLLTFEESIKKIRGTPSLNKKDC